MEPEPQQEVPKQRTKYDRALLDKVLERDGATLVGNSEAYKKLNRETKIKFVCKCGESGEKSFRSFIDYGGVLCNKCLNKNKLQKFKISSKEKYGVENPFQNKDIIEKSKKTMREKYGVEYALQNKDLKNKFEDTTLRKYGVRHHWASHNIIEKRKLTFLDKYKVSHPSKNKDIINKIRNSIFNKYGVYHITQNEIIKKKIENTNMKKYGFKTTLLTQNVKDKIKKTNIKKFGVEHPASSNIIKQKTIETNIKKYGFKCSLQNENIKEKSKQTCVERYGVEYPAQSQEIQERRQKNSHQYKEFKMPSGTIRKVQGYEPFALRDLLKTYTEDQIKTDRKEVGRIKYKVEGDEKDKYYFPDIYLPHEKKYIEVKSSWTAKQKPELIEAKAKACREQGYACEIWVYDAKGGRIEC